MVALGGQFSQPHLPGMHVKPTDEHRYQRGFTPERMAEVKQALPAGRIYGQVYEEKPPEHGAFMGHRNLDRESSWMGRNEGKAKVQETVARSTIDVSSMKPVQVWAGQKYDSDNGGGGFYRVSGEGVIADTPAIRVHPIATDAIPTKPLDSKRAETTREMRQGQEQTLLHELGHHDSASRGLPHSSVSEPMFGVRPSTVRGREEAYADDYAVEHYRPDPRDARRGEFERSGYDRGGTVPRNPYVKDDETDHSDEHHDFAAGYYAQRQHPNVKPPHKYDDPEAVGVYPSGMPKYKSDPDIEGQRRLFLRKGRLAEETSPDYGQHPLYKTEPTGEFYRDGSPKEADVDLPTIKLGRGVPKEHRR